MHYLGIVLVLNEGISQTVSDHERLEVDVCKSVLVGSERGNGKLALVVIMDLFTNSRNIVASI